MNDETTTRQVVNFSNEDFTHNWDSKPHTLKAGESRIFPKFLADHLSKHLVDREMHKLGIRTDDARRKEFEDRALGIEIEHSSPEELEIALLNEKAAEVKEEIVIPTAKPKGRPKKVKEVAEEKEFEDLENS